MGGVIHAAFSPVAARLRRRAVWSMRHEPARLPAGVVVEGDRERVRRVGEPADCRRERQSAGPAAQSRRGAGSLLINLVA
jgi:hypothetical protein